MMQKQKVEIMNHVDKLESSVKDTSLSSRKVSFLVLMVDLKIVVYFQRVNSSK